LIQSRTTRRFRQGYENLPEEIRRQARQAYRLFQKDPHHPSLRFKKVDEASNTFSVRVGLGYRALGVTEGSTIVWCWIGSHADYARLI
jgi:mRNA-degrading endonuclease RelE of RelBE toxin-antitoxin system